MKTAANRTIFLAVIALSLALLACADPGRSGPKVRCTGRLRARRQRRPAAPPARHRWREARAGQTPKTIGGVPVDRGRAEHDRDRQEDKNSVVFITNIQLVRDFFFGAERRCRAAAARASSGTTRATSSPTSTSSRTGVEFMVTLPNQEQRQAKLVGKEESKDIAVLKLQGDLSGLSPVSSAPPATSRSARRSSPSAIPSASTTRSPRASSAPWAGKILGRGQRHDPRHDPDRRLDQPGQLGRAAPQLRRRAHRHEHDDLLARRGVERRRLRRSRGHHQENRPGAHPLRQGHRAPAWASPSCPTSMPGGPVEGAVIMEVQAGTPAYEPACAG